MTARDRMKSAGRAMALVLVLPWLCSFHLRALVMGRNRALEGSTQMLALWPGLLGQYLRRAFLARTLAHCAATAAVEFGTIFSDVRARIDEGAYVGPRCHLGLVHIGADALLAAGVHVPSGARTHGIADMSPIRDQPGTRTVVRIGRGAWIGSAAVVMADVGDNSVVGAGAVVSRPLPDGVVAVGVPACVIRTRRDGERTA